MKCWAPDKAYLHPGYVDGRLGEDDVAAFRDVLARCRDEMSKGQGYPRLVEMGTDDFEVQHSGLWDLATWNSTWRLPWEAQSSCRCTLDKAVSAYLWSPFTLQHNVPGDLGIHCPCTIDHAWSSYAHVFNISFTSGMPWPTNLRIALGWLALKHNVSYPQPLAYVLPRPNLHGFFADHLPPRGRHMFWLDTGPRGLPRDSAIDMGVPKALTDELRRWGRAGVNRHSQVEARQAAMPDLEKRACVSWGWCFEGPAI